MKIIDEIIDEDHYIEVFLTTKELEKLKRDGRIHAKVLSMSEKREVVMVGIVLEVEKSSCINN